LSLSSGDGSPKGRLGCLIFSEDWIKTMKKLLKAKKLGCFGRTAEQSSTDWLLEIKYENQD